MYFCKFFRFSTFLSVVVGEIGPVYIFVNSVAHIKKFDYRPFFSISYILETPEKVEG